MNPDDKPAEMSKEEYGIGYDGKDGDVMIVTIPLRKWAMDSQYGDILVMGVFEKAKRVALKNIQIMRDIKKQSGIITAKATNPKTVLDVV